MKKFIDWLPSGPLTPTSAVLGWMWMVIGVLIMLLPDQLMVSTTKAYLRDVPPVVFGMENFLVGFFISKPGKRARRLKHFFGTLLCVNWIGVCLYPGMPWTEVDGDISALGVVLWLSLALLITLDADSMTYSRKYNERHHGDDLMAFMRNEGD